MNSVHKKYDDKEQLYNQNLVNLAKYKVQSELHQKQNKYIFEKVQKGSSKMLIEKRQVIKYNLIIGCDKFFHILLKFQGYKCVRKVYMYIYNMFTFNILETFDHRWVEESRLDQPDKMSYQFENSPFESFINQTISV